jgi:hypothetical protein
MFRVYSVIPRIRQSQAGDVSTRLYDVSGTLYIGDLSPLSIFSLRLVHAPLLHSLDGLSVLRYLRFPPKLSTP